MCEDPQLEFWFVKSIELPLLVKPRLQGEQFTLPTYPIEDVGAWEPIEHVPYMPDPHIDPGMWGQNLRVTQYIFEKHGAQELVLRYLASKGPVESSFLTQLRVDVFPCSHVFATDVRITSHMYHKGLVIMAEGMEYPSIFINSHFMNNGF